jgi:preprotein translocase subunit SecG
MVVLALVLVVLLQRSEGGALGIGGGGGGGLMSSRGTANILTRATAILAVGFFATSLALSLIAKNQERPGSILDAVPTATQGVPATGDAPVGDGSGGILDSLKQQSEPSGPQVPAAQ